MVLDGQERPERGHDGELFPLLRRPHLLERERLLKRADVSAVRNAWHLDQLEDRVGQHAEKSKVKDVTGQKAKIRHGMQIRLTGKGPDAR